MIVMSMQLTISSRRDIAVCRRNPRPLGARRMSKCRMPRTLQLSLPTPAATELLGEVLARSLPQPAGAGTVLYLRGELGAGKTTCVRSFLRSLGVTGTVRSPTYSLLETYALAPLMCVHIDLYRVRTDSEVEELGLRDLLDEQHLLLIEWPDKGGLAVPAAALELQLEYAREGRLASLNARREAGDTWLANLGRDNRLVPYVSNLT
jgi:tRNA threonylcarbamoyladenosine biosynthesis protein TsaE